MAKKTKFFQIQCFKANLWTPLLTYFEEFFFAKMTARKNNLNLPKGLK